MPVKRSSLCLGIAAAVLFASRARAELVDRIAAVVNSDIISLSEVEKRAAPELALTVNSDSKERATQRNRVIHQALDQLVADKLIDWQLKEQPIDVTDQEVEVAVEDVKNRNGFDNEKLELALREQGMTIASWKTDVLKKQVARLRLIQKRVEGKVKVTDEDVKAAYQRWVQMETEDPEIRARHILIRSESNSPQDVEKALEKARKVTAEARKPGADFAELAKKYGEGTTAQSGGDLGYFRRGIMFQEFEKVAFALKIGEVSDPVKTELGWHVIKLEERRSVAVKSFDEMAPSLRDKLRTAQLEKASEAVIQELKQSAVVEIKI